MKLIASLLLLVACDCCLGQTDTKLIAAGGWSEAVRDAKCLASLRGRLLVYYDEEPSTNNYARVYLELQHVGPTNAWNLPVAVYYAPCGTDANLQFEMSGEDGRRIRRMGGIRWGAGVPPCWVTLPCDATLRLRADLHFRPTPKPSGLEIDISGGPWVIAPQTTNGFLSGTFTPYCFDHPGLRRGQVWQGSLKLPGVKIAVN